VRVRIFRTEREASLALARRVAADLAAHPAIVLGLPTGRTPVHLYRELVKLHARGDADFSRASTFNLDEFLGIPPSHPGSYRSFMEGHLFAHVNLAKERTHFLDGSAADSDAECARYDREIDAAGGIDLQILGVGTNGHIGFNEPARALEPRTHRVALKPSTRRSNAALFGGDADAVPREALSMGLATIMQARAIVLLATGKSKAGCVGRMVGGPITTRMPASCLQLHPNAELLLDEAAASQRSKSANRPVDDPTTP
jgi:glucosamine-6-phosphate deaminase